MNLKHLETFYHFCRFMNVSKAADQLNVTQPAVSQQLRAFQDECGVQLLYRHSGEYRLTEAGEALFLLSKRIFSRVGQIENLLHMARKSESQTLRVGTTKTFARMIMPDLIARFQETHPLVHVHLSEGNSADLIRRVMARKEDLVVVARTRYDSSLRAIPFNRCDFLLVARPDHPLTKHDEVSIKCLNGESMIIRERGSGSRDAILKTLQEHGVTPSVLVESESLSFILAYMERRMAVSFLVDHEIQNEIASEILKQIPLREGNISFHTDIVIRRKEPMSEPMKHFLKILKSRT